MTIPLEPPNRNYFTSSNPNKKKKNKGYVVSSKDDHLLRAVRMMEHAVDEQLSRPTLTDIFNNFPENSLIGDYSNSSQDSFFKYFIDLFFNRKKVLKFIDDLNIEMMSVDDHQFTVDSTGFIYISNSNTLITITPVMRSIIYRNNYKETIKFHIRKKDYIQLKKIIEVRLETKKMNKLYDKISKL